MCGGQLVRTEEGFDLHWHLRKSRVIGVMLWGSSEIVNQPYS